MRKLILLFLLIVLQSCEDVIQVETPSEKPRLIIEALIRIDTDKTDTNVKVKVSQTSSFFESIKPVTLQQISITNLDLNSSNNLIEEETGSGVYSVLLPTNELTQGELVLQIQFEDQIYEAHARYVPSVPLNSVKQGDGFLFDENDTEIIINYTDDAYRTDYYLFDFGYANFLASEDTFYNGQEFEFSYFYDENFEPDTELEISIMGIDKPFYNYMNLIIEQSGQNEGPFETTNITARGNFTNKTNLDNYALGYFSVAQEFKTRLTIQ